MTHIVSIYGILIGIELFDIGYNFFKAAFDGFYPRRNVMFCFMLTGIINFYNHNTCNSESKCGNIPYPFNSFYINNSS